MYRNSFFNNPTTTQSLNQAIQYINVAIAFFREKQLPVISIQHVDPEDDLIPGKEGFDLPEQLLIEPTDLHIHKTYGNSFNKTPLAEELRKQGVDTIIVTGYCAEYCVLSTFRGAQDLDFQPILLRGGIASRTPEHIPFVVAINEVVSYKALKKMLENC